MRNDNSAFIENSRKFFNEIFFPYLDANQIRTVIHLGDVLDRRKYVNIKTAEALRKNFLEPLKEREIDTHIIIGNHDTYYKNTNKVNSLNELIADKYDNITIYQEKPIEKVFGGLPILFIPWICEDNYEETWKVIDETKSQIAMGHLEIDGFEMYRGSIVSGGINRSTFNKFDLVFSGHFHHRSSDGHIFYLGSHAEFTWSDYDDPRGFHIFDTETREIEFVVNPFRMFKKVWYNDSEIDYSREDYDFTEFKNCMVKVIVKEKNNLYWFDRFIEKLENVNPLHLQIIEDSLNLDLEESDLIDEAESTIDIMKKYIDNYDIKTVSKEKVVNAIQELYLEALEIE